LTFCPRPRSNAELIKNLVGGIQQAGQKQAAKAMKATNLSNLMMQLRKACAHPYLNQEDIEDKTVGPEEMHKRLTEASAKLSFLKLLLPKLFQKGHRILLFSGVSLLLPRRPSVRRSDADSRSAPAVCHCARHPSVRAIQPISI
jgi:hypothetical protein